MKQTIDDYILNVLKNLNYKKVIVTGATSGIGLALARILVFKNAYLIMAVRNVLKGNLLKDKLLEEFPKAKIDVLPLDQGDFNSIDKFVTKINATHPDYDSLVINAGVFNSEKGVLLDNGYPIVSGTNMFGPIYLVNELIKIDPKSIGVGQYQHDLPAKQLGLPPHRHANRLPLRSPCAAFAVGRPKRAAW